VQAEDIDVDGGAGGKCAGRMPDFLHHNRGFRHAETGTAILLRHCDPEPAAFRNCVGEFMGEAVGAVFFQPVMVVKLVTDGTDRIPECRSVRVIAEGFELLHVGASFLGVSVSLCRAADG
jgi:hypothetical protein